MVASRLTRLSLLLNLNILHSYINEEKCKYLLPVCFDTSSAPDYWLPIEDGNIIEYKFKITYACEDYSLTAEA